MTNRAAALAATPNRFADVLFVVQLLCAFGFGYAQFTTMLSSTAGVSVSWLALWLAFLCINLALALNALRTSADRVIRQTVIVYVAWALMAALNLVALLVFGGSWHAIDTLTGIITAFGAAAVLVVGRRYGLSAVDPYVRAGLAICFKTVPQLTLGWLIFEIGGEGMATFTVISGHITINMRIYQVWLSIREAGWDRNRSAIMLGEIANEISWVVVTVVWLWVR